MWRSTWRSAGALLCLIATLSFSAHAQLFGNSYGDDKYTPRMGQDGKDVIWIPTGNDLVRNMLEMAKVGSSDLVYDLGAGDGKIAIAAAREFGATSVGIEFNGEMAALAKRNAERAGVGKRVQIIHGEIFKEDFSQASVVTMYLLPELNLKLRPTLLKMKPGTRLVSHAFDMGDWEPDQTIREPGTAYLWIVPAEVGGYWQLDRVDGEKARLYLVQRYQKVGGTLMIGKRNLPLMNPHLEGNQLTFSFIDRKQVYRTVQLIIKDGNAKGEEKGHGILNEVTGRRVN